MRQLKIIGLAVVVALALGAFAAASSQAAYYGVCNARKHGYYLDSGCTQVALKRGVPDYKGSYEIEEFKTCVAQKHGNYLDSGCTQAALKNGVPDHKGGYEAVLPISFTLSGGPTEFRASEGLVSCVNRTGFGLVESGTTATVSYIFTGCERDTLPCTGHSSTPGTIKTFTLDEKLIDNSFTRGPETEITGTRTEGSGPYVTDHILGFADCVAGEEWLRNSGFDDGQDQPVNAITSAVDTQFEEEAFSGPNTQGLVWQYALSAPPGGFEPWFYTDRDEEIASIVTNYARPIKIVYP